MNPKTTLSFFAGGLCLCLLTMQPNDAAATGKKNPVENPIGEEKPAKTDRLNSSRNNTAVKIYPDIVQKAMHVVAKDNDGKEIDFFVFDMDGTLMKHYKMTDGEHKKLSGLSRGKYIYHVFCGDDETAIGRFEIR